jgi:hypothetical protein
MEALTKLLLTVNHVEVFLGSLLASSTDTDEVNTDMNLTANYVTPIKLNKF